MSSKSYTLTSNVNVSFQYFQKKSAEYLLGLSMLECGDRNDEEGLLGYEFFSSFLFFIF